MIKIDLHIHTIPTSSDASFTFDISALRIDVKTDEYHHVCHMIPTLDWTSGILGIRLRLEPKDIQKLYLSYSADYKRARKNAGDTKVELYPKSLWAYLDRGNRLNEFTKSFMELLPELTVFFIR